MDLSSIKLIFISFRSVFFLSLHRSAHYLFVIESATRIDPTRYNPLRNDLLRLDPLLTSTNPNQTNNQVYIQLVRLL